MNSGKLVQKLSSEQFFFKSLKEKVTLDSRSIISEFINGKKIEMTVFLF